VNRSTIVGLLAGIVVTPILAMAYATAIGLVLDRDLQQWGRHDAAFDMAHSLFVSVELFRRDHQRVPTAEEGLPILVPQYVRGIPVDPWGNPFLYVTRGPDWADVVSTGADGDPGGTGIATDVSARYGSPGTTTSRFFAQGLFVLLLLPPGIAYAASERRRSAAAALAGTAVFWGWVVAATVAPHADPSLALLGAFAAIVVALSGAVLTLRELPGGPGCALAGTLGCLVATAAMVG
jgi:general secretion pathway protein G